MRAIAWRDSLTNDMLVFFGRVQWASVAKRFHILPLMFPRYSALGLSVQGFPPRPHARREGDKARRLFGFLSFPLKKFIVPNKIKSNLMY